MCRTPPPVTAAVGQTTVWVEGVAKQRVYGTTGEIPGRDLLNERPELRPLPGAEMLEPFVRKARRLQRDGSVQWRRVWYGAPGQPWCRGSRPTRVSRAATLVPQSFGNGSASTTTTFCTYRIPVVAQHPPSDSFGCRCRRQQLAAGGRGGPERYPDQPPPRTPPRSDRCCRCPH